MIETTVDKKYDLTIHKCYEDIKTNELIDAVNSFYNGLPTQHTLWDFSNASLDSIPTEGVRKIFTVIKELGSAREGGKTAIVTPTDLGYGLARMLQIMSNTDDFPFTIKVFRHYKNASQWLFGEE